MEFSPPSDESEALRKFERICEAYCAEKKRLGRKPKVNLHAIGRDMGVPNDEIRRAQMRVWSREKGVILSIRPRKPRSPSVSAFRTTFEPVEKAA